jgi:hypothetical protein
MYEILFVRNVGFIEMYFFFPTRECVILIEIISVVFSTDDHRFDEIEIIKTIRLIFAILFETLSKWR